VSGAMATPELGGDSDVAFAELMNKACVTAAQQRHKFFFIDYSGLSKAVESLGGGDASDGDAGKKRAELEERMNTELKKINDYVCLQFETLDLQLANTKKATTDSRQLDDYAEDIVFLDVFIKLNLEGFRRIMARCDRLHNTGLGWFNSRVEGAAFRQHNLNQLLSQLGRLYSQWRKKTKYADSGSDMTNMVYETLFFDPKHAIRVKAILSKYLEICASRVTETQQADAATRVPRRRRASKDSVSLGQNTTHVYYDNPYGDQYRERHHQRKVASYTGRSQCTFYCRWSGENKAGGVDDVTLVAEGARSSNKPIAKVTIKQRDMSAFASKRLDTDAALRHLDESENISSQKALLDELQDMISRCSLHPVVSVTFNRSSFAMVGVGESVVEAQAVTTVDEELCFIDEESGVAGAKTWCRAARGDLDEVAGGRMSLAQVIVRAPAPSSGSSPVWREALLALQPKKVPGFSKGLQGTVLFHPRRAHPPPPWLENQDAFGRQDESPEFPAMPIEHRHSARSPFKSPHQSARGMLPSFTELTPARAEGGLFQRLSNCVAACTKPCDSDQQDSALKVDRPLHAFPDSFFLFR